MTVHSIGGVGKIACATGLLLAFLLALPVGLPAQTTTNLFDDSVLHEVRLTMKAADWQALKDHYKENLYYTVDSFQWQAGANTASVNNISVRSRGRGSRSPIKPGLRLDFNRNVKGQTFFGLSALVLKSNTQDGSLLHERISMLLFRRMGIAAPREVSAKVYVNGEYLGLYNIAENIDQDFLTRIFKESNGYLYEYTPGDWTGMAGFGYHFEYLGQDLSVYSSSTTPTPFDPHTHSNAPDTVTLEGMIRTMNQASDADFISAVTPYLDLKLWLTHVAVESYVSDFDCILGDAFGMNNFFLYRFENKKLSQFIAWDKDNAFDWNERPILRNADLNVLMRRLLAIPEYRNAYFEALVKCAILAGSTTGWMEQEAAREYIQIRDAAYQDPNKTHLETGVQVPISNADFDAAVAFVKAFAGIRTPYVLSSVKDQGYQLPSTYPSLPAGPLFSAAAAVPAAAGGLGSIYGANLGTGDTTSIYINGFPAPALFVSPGQVNLQVPWETAGTVMVGAIVNGAPSNIITASVNTYSPGVFATAHLDGSAVTTDSPAAANETLVIYATGLGPVMGDVVTGQVASFTTLQRTTRDPTVTIGGVQAVVSFSGLAPGYIGAYQVNVNFPSGTPAGSQPQLFVSIGGQTSPPTALAAK